MIRRYAKWLRTKGLVIKELDLFVTRLGEAARRAKNIPVPDEYPNIDPDECF